MKVCQYFLLLITLVLFVYAKDKNNASLVNEFGSKLDQTKRAQKNKVVAGLICFHNESSTYDLNFIKSFKEACEARGLVENETYFISMDVPEDETSYDEALKLVAKGCNLIFADSFGFEDHMIKAAKKEPNVHFCHATGTKAHTENLPNYHNAFASIHDGRYMTGVAAGMKLNEMIANNKIKKEEAKLGYVGAFKYAEVISGYSAFYLGAKSVCPSVTMLVRFTDSWYDEAKEKDYAHYLISEGCKIISQHSDSLGAPKACEEEGVPNIPYNGSTIKVGPKTFIVSSKIEWTPYFNYVMESIEDGEKFSTDWTGTIETGSVVLSDFNEAVAANGTADAVAEVRRKLMSGKIYAFDTSTFTVNGKKVTSYLADVDSDPEFKPDTEAIIDDIFQESELRSAPYFDMLVDGISIYGEENNSNTQSSSSTLKVATTSFVAIIVSVATFFFLL